MYPASGAFNTAIWAANRAFERKLTIATVARTFVLTDADLTALSLQDAVVSQDTIEVGSAIAKSLEFVISNLDGRFDDDIFAGAEVTFEVNLNAIEWIPMGKYYVDEAPRPGQLIEVSAFDSMVKFDVPFTSELVFPTTALNVLNVACSLANITLATVAFPNSGYMIEEVPSNLSARQVVQYIAQMAGRFARVNRSNQLTLAWYTATTETVTAANITQLTLEEPITVTGVIYLDTSNEEEYIAGVDTYAITLPENPLVKQNIATVLENIAGHLIGTAFTPGVATHRGNPCWDAGDIITFVDKFAVSHTFLVCDNNYNFNGFSCETISAGQTEEQAGYATPSVLNKQASIIRQEIKKIDLALADEITDREQAIIDVTAMISGSNGGYVLQRTGEILIMDHQDPELATKIWRWNQAGLAFSSNVVGADNPSRAYSTAITMDGQIVATFITTGILVADIIKSGLLKSLNDVTWIDMETGAFALGPNLTWDGTTLTVTGKITVVGGNAATQSYAQAKAAEAQAAAEAYADLQLLNYVDATEYGQDLADLQSQIDGSITTWFYDYTPSLINLPASEWTTNDIKNQHLGDLFYSGAAETLGYVYRFQISGTYSWVRITDSDVTKALADAANAQDTADAKRRSFYAQPTPPYDVGDLWVQGTAGDLMRCTVARGTGGAYNPADWTKAVKYTDDVAANAYADTKKAEAITAAKAYADITSSAAQAAAEAYALAKANLAETNAEAYADGIVTVEEQARIKEAAANLSTARTYADTKKAEAEAALKSYVQSRGENLVTNGTGLLGNNTNFSALKFDGLDNYSANGSFTDVTFSSIRFNDEIIPVNTDLKYKFLYYIKAKPYVGANGFGMVVCHDADGYQILPPNTMYIANTLTTLAQDLKNGDTVLRLTSAANWINSAGVHTHRRVFILWNYVNSFGYAFPELTYSRNVSAFNIWADGAVDYVNNRITLRAPWAGGLIPAGTKLSNGSSSGTYKYIAGTNFVIPQNWEQKVGYISGIDLTGTSIVNKFHPGTAGVKIGWLLNRTIAGNKTWLSNIFFGVDLETPDGAQAKVDALQATLDQDIADVDARVTALDTYVNGAFADGIISEAEAKAIEKYINTVSSEKADVDNRYTAIYGDASLSGTPKTNLASAKSAYDTAHTNLINSINTAIADSATTPAEKADVDTKFTSYKNALATLSTRFEEAVTAIVQTKVDAVQVGGRNLLKKSDFDASFSAWVFSGAGTIADVQTDSIYGKYLRTSRAINYRAGGLAAGTIKTGEKVTISFYAKGNQSQTRTFRLIDGGLTKPLHSSNQSFVVSTSWQKFVFTYTALNDIDGSQGLYLYGSSNNSILLYITQIKVERGDKATDWTPAPEDTVQLGTAYNSVTITPEDGVKAVHPDGSYTQLSAGGLERYVSGTGKHYFYEQYKGVVSTIQTSTTQQWDDVKGSGYEAIYEGAAPVWDSYWGRLEYYDILFHYAPVTVTLPSEYQGKQFVVEARPKYHFVNQNRMNSVLLQAFNYWYRALVVDAYDFNYEAGTFKIKAYMLSWILEFGWISAGVDVEYIIL